jgi:hypothetical protein
VLPGSREHETVQNNRLLVSVARAFGVDIDHCGNQADQESVAGALPAL